MVAREACYCFGNAHAEVGLIFNEEHLFLFGGEGESSNPRLYFDLCSCAVPFFQGKMFGIPQYSGLVGTRLTK